VIRQPFAWQLVAKRSQTSWLRLPLRWNAVKAITEKFGRILPSESWQKKVPPGKFHKEFTQWGAFGGISVIALGSGGMFGEFAERKSSTR
jgi:hypothetical protein